MKHSPKLPSPAPPWKAMQDSIVREILAEMGRRRMTGRDLCEKAGLSTSHWSEMRNLKKPISFDRLVKITDAIGMRLSVSFSPMP